MPTENRSFPFQTGADQMPLPGDHQGPNYPSSYNDCMPQFSWQRCGYCYPQDTSGFFERTHAGIIRLKLCCLKTMMQRSGGGVCGIGFRWLERRTGMPAGLDRGDWGSPWGKRRGLRGRSAWPLRRPRCPVQPSVCRRPPRNRPVRPFFRIQPQMLQRGQADHIDAVNRPVRDPLPLSHTPVVLLQAPDVKPMVFENRLPVTDVPRLHICGYRQMKRITCPQTAVKSSKITPGQVKILNFGKNNLKIFNQKQGESFIAKTGCFFA
jgi:hypothetical protein